jgi:hypothetical protein
MFLAEIVFASRILGLVAGDQQIQIQVDPSVRSVEVRRDGERVTSLNGPPWLAKVNFGTELTPHELTVIGRDAEGNELGRDTQPVNVARPAAELGVLLDRDPQGKMIAKIRWGHFAHELPKDVVVKLDGRQIRKERIAATASLGAVDASKIHVLSVEVTFRDGVKSRREVVFGGGFSEQMPAELTPVAVRQQKETTNKRASCFRTAAGALPDATIEHGDATVFFVINGSRLLAMRNEPTQAQGDALFAMPKVNFERVNPAPQRIRQENGVTEIFDFRSSEGVRGTRRMVNSARQPVGIARIADAVGAAALRALRGGQRRAIVVMIGDGALPDRGVHTPATIRRYLRRVGVPLRVWSLTGPRPDLAETWGEVIDVSTEAGLLAATRDLRNELDSQRVAWLPVAPLDAFRVMASEDCAFAPLAE